MNVNEIQLLPLFEKFITDSQKGKRLKKNGRKLKPETVDNYKYVYANLNDFLINTTFSFRLKPYDKLDKRERESERNYWKKFYKQFTEYLYLQKKCHDNYVGGTIKILRVFFNYLKSEKLISTGDFFKNFYVIKEEIPIITLSYDQLQFLIFNTEFRISLPKHLEVSLDIFILGCTVALRVSDIFNLYPRDIEKVGEHYYLKNRSQKMETVTRVRLPEYAVIIIKKYYTTRGRIKVKSKLFPAMSLRQFNCNIKRIAEMAGWIHPIGKQRSQQGKINEIYQKENKSIYRFCDMVSSHVMRRTAITTMLILGMPEHLVRKISGHSHNSQAFYRYVNYAQAFLDNEIGKIHEKLENVNYG